MCDACVCVCVLFVCVCVYQNVCVCVCCKIWNNDSLFTKDPTRRVHNITKRKLSHTCKCPTSCCRSASWLLCNSSCCRSRSTSATSCCSRACGYNPSHQYLSAINSCEHCYLTVICISLLTAVTFSPVDTIYMSSVRYVVVVVVVVAISSCVRIWGECSTIHSPHVLFFF